MTADLASLGPFFAVGRHRPRSAQRAPWRPLTDLTAGTEALVSRIGAVRRALAANADLPPDEIDLRVAASIAQLGIVARIIAPAIGAASLGRALSSRSSDWRWQDTLGGPFPLSIAETGSRIEHHHSLLDSAIGPITAAVSTVVAVSPRVLWGNVASAVNSAAMLIGITRPDLADAARLASSAWRNDRRLAGETGPHGSAFRRTSCCLLYRLAPAGTRAICGDCVLSR